MGLTALEKRSKSASSSGRRPDAPEIDHPYVFSVSQVETFLTCPRKWGFDKIDGIPSEPNRFAELGQDVHGVLEEYLGKAIPIDPDTRAGRIAMPGIKFLPYPRAPGMRVERWFAIEFGVAAYRGLKDIEIIQGSSIPLVLDHKTTRSWDWKKTKHELLRDVQAGIYAADAMQKTGADEVALRWLYYRTEGAPLSEPVDVTIDRKQVSNILSFVNHTAKRMIRVLQTCSKAMDVEPDYSGCSAYGGCPHRKSRCKPKAVKVLKAIMAQKKAQSDRRKHKEKSTEDFLKYLEERKEKSSGGKKKTRKKADIIEVDDVEAADVINSPDREAAERPGPPPAKQVGGEWVQAEWDEAEWEWKFPEGTEEKEKTQMAKKKKKEKSGRRSAADILAGVHKKKKPKDTKKNKRKREEEEEEEPEEEEEEPEDEEEEDDEEEDEEGDESESDLLDQFVDLLADRIAQRLKK